MTRACVCGHDPAEHHLDRMAVYCLGDLVFVMGEKPELEMCGCIVYEPAGLLGSLHLS